MKRKQILVSTLAVMITFAVLLPSVLAPIPVPVARGYAFVRLGRWRYARGRAEMRVTTPFVILVVSNQVFMWSIIKSETVDGISYLTASPIVAPSKILVTLHHGSGWVQVTGWGVYFSGKLAPP